MKGMSRISHFKCMKVMRIFTRNYKFNILCIALVMFTPELVTSLTKFSDIPESYRKNVNIQYQFPLTF